MIVILNGALGVGKTETAWALLKHFPKAAIYDCDYVGCNVRPYDYKDPSQVASAFRSLAALAADQQRESNVEHFVIAGVFESEGQLQSLIRLLEPLQQEVKTYLLRCDREEHERRVLARNNNITSELRRSRELHRSLDAASRVGNIGKPLGTTGLSIARAAEWIAADLALP